MGTRLLSSCITLFLLAVIIYTIYTNFDGSNDSKVEIKEDILQEIVDIEEDDSTISYQMIEEPVLHGHNEYDSEGERIAPDVHKQNSKAPEIELQTLAGETVKLSNFQGKKVFINFWATWCPPCIDEMPEIQNYYNNHAEKQNVIILSINATDLEGNQKSIDKFVQDYNLSFPVLLDEVGEASFAYEVLTIPTSYIINEEGNVIEQIVGPVTEKMLNEKFSR